MRKIPLLFASAAVAESSDLVFIDEKILSTAVIPALPAHSDYVTDSDSVYRRLQNNHIRHLPGSLLTSLGNLQKL